MDADCCMWLFSGAHCLFIRGSEDPVVEQAHVANFAQELQAQSQPGISVEVRSILDLILSAMYDTFSNNTGGFIFRCR
jgi:hypothetical protein